MNSVQSAIGNRQSAIRSILVIKPSSLGDIVHTLPAVALLKKMWPQARLRWLVNSEWMPLLEGNPHVDEVVEFPRKNFRGPAGWSRIPVWAKTLAQKKSDLVLDFQGLLRSALIAKLCRADGGRIAGLSDAREGARHFYDETADTTGKLHAVDRYLALIAALGIDTAAPLEWPLPQGSAPIGFDETQPFILLHPFSRGTGKSLTAADASEFCRTLAPHRIVIAGRAETKLPPLENTADFLNRTTLAELIWLIRRAAFTVSVDSGPMHIAAALTPHLLAIHTWSDPRKVGPYQPDAWIWKNRALFQMKNAANITTHLPAPGIVDVARFVASLLA